MLSSQLDAFVRVIRNMDHLLTSITALGTAKSQNEYILA